MNSEIEDLIKKCPTDLTFRNRQLSEAIINHPIPNQAWKKIIADPFCLYGHYYLLIVMLLLFQIYCHWNAEKFTIFNCYK